MRTSGSPIRITYEDDIQAPINSKNHLPHAAGAFTDKTNALLPQLEFLDLAAGRLGVVGDPEDMFGDWEEVVNILIE